MKYIILSSDKAKVMHISNSPLYKDYIRYDANDPIIKAKIEQDSSIIAQKQAIQNATNNLQQKELEKQLRIYILRTYEAKQYLIENNAITHTVLNNSEKQLSNSCIVATADNPLVIAYELQELKNKKIEELESEYHQSKANAIVKYNGVEYGVNKKYNFQDLLEMATQWQEKDNTTIISGVNITRHECYEIKEKMIAYRGAIRNNNFITQQDIMSFTTKEQVENHTPSNKIYFDSEIDFVKTLEELL